MQVVIICRIYPGNLGTKQKSPPAKQLKRYIHHVPQILEVMHEYISTWYDESPRP